jgi:hypothetical protein
MQNREIRERVDLYHALAAEAAVMATNAIPQAWKNAYADIALHWSQLARELEVCAEPLSLVVGIPDSQPAIDF